MKFIVIGLPKTGKTMVVHTLNKISEFRVLGEIFNTKDRSPKMPVHPQKVIEDDRLRDQRNNLHTWYCNKIGAKKFDITDDILAGNTFDLITQFLKTIYLPDKHCGFKLHHHHIELTPQLETYIAVHPAIKMIHCLRRNKVKQALATIGNRCRGEKFECTPHGALNVIHDYEFRTSEIRRMFSYRENYKEIYYEDMTGDIDQSILDVTEIQKFFDVAMPDKVVVDIRKNTRNKISENLLNYDEFRLYFKNTIYERFID